MKKLKLPKIEQSDSDYKLWGISIPKIQNGHLPMLKRERSKKNLAAKDTSPPKAANNRLTIVHNADDVISKEMLDNGLEQNSAIEACRGSGREASRVHSTVGIPEKEGSNSCQSDQFTDIVFSFFSSTDQTYVVHRSSGDYVDTERCKSVGSGNEYEIMNAQPVIITQCPSATELNSKQINDDSKLLHKSELTFYVSATSLKEDTDINEDDTDVNYDLPSNRPVSNLSNSSYTVQNKSLNDMNGFDGDETPKYQNSASLDNLSQVCNISLKNADSKRSISSLPELESLNRKNKEFNNNSFASPKVATAINRKSSIRRNRLSYFDNNQKAIKLKNRISAFYLAHKDFKGKKRLSKAWYGVKDWFETEKLRVDKMIHNKRIPKRNVTKSSGDDYPDSEFSDYEDVPNSHGSIDSFGKVEDIGDASVISGSSGRSIKKGKYNLCDEAELNRREVRSLSACNSAIKLNSLKEEHTYYVNGIQDQGNLRHSRSQPSVMLISEPVLLKVNCGDVEQNVESSMCDDERELLNGESISPDSVSVKSDHFDDVTDSALLPQQNEQDNFASLRSIVKEGSVMCKELINILQQRAEAERQYCCGVLRVGARARRVAKGASWAALASRRAAIDMEARAQLHRQFSNRLVEEIIRPLQRLVSSRDAVRKQVESDVGRTERRLNELRDCEARCKKSSHTAARFNERLQDTSVGRNATPGQEAELRKKKTKSEDAASKGDVEYYMACVRAERARVEWETAVTKGLESLVVLEEERLACMKKALKLYVKLTTLLGPGAPSEECKQLETMLSGALKGEGRVARGLLSAAPPPMYLPDFYSQHITLAMNKERRKQALLKILELVKNDMERERKSKQALEKLSLAITTTPNFGSNDSQQNASEKLYHMRSLLTYLEGARVQAAGALLALGGRPRPPHPLAPHITMHRDRRGLQQTILTVPPWLRQEFRPTGGEVQGGRASPPDTPALSSVARSSPPPSPGSSVAWGKDRGVADGVSVQHYSDIDDNIIDSPPARPPPPVLPVMKNHQQFTV